MSCVVSQSRLSDRATLSLFSMAASSSLAISSHHSVVSTSTALPAPQNATPTSVHSPSQHTLSSATLPPSAALASPLAPQGVRPPLGPLNTTAQTSEPRGRDRMPWGRAEKDDLEEFVESKGSHDEHVADFIHDYSLFKNKAYPQFFGSLVWVTQYVRSPP